MENRPYLIQLDESEVLKLPYAGPVSRRFYIITYSKSSTSTRELFNQRNDAFATNLIGLLKSIKEREISEVRYSFRYDGFIRIFLDEKGKLVGECSCKSEKTLQDFRKELEIK